MAKKPFQKVFVDGGGALNTFRFRLLPTNKELYCSDLCKQDNFICTKAILKIILNESNLALKRLFKISNLSLAKTIF